jgi:hypothetical protein
MTNADDDYAQDLADWYAEDADLWDRPILKHINNFARSRRACPDSTLAAVLVRAVCQIPPWVTLPPIIGGRTAVNLFAALVGESGAGKGASEAAARDAITWDNPALEVLKEQPLGSGEGLARTYMDMEDATDTLSVLWCAPEIDTLRALFVRQGSTLEAELRKLYMGEQLGFTNARKDSRTLVRRLSYRAGLIAGVQPLRSAVLLGAADGGTPQRFLWALTRDRDMPEQRPDEIEATTVKVPKFLGGDLYVPAAARDAIERHQLDYHHGEPDVDPLDGHALLTRLKVAAALMVLDERARINDTDWALAGRVMVHSTTTRAAVARATEEQRHRANRGKAADTAERDETIAEIRLARVKRNVLRWLDKQPDGVVTAHHELRRRLKANDRDDFDPAIAQLIEEGRIIKVKLERGDGYAKVHGYTAVHGTSPAETEYTDRYTAETRVPQPCFDVHGTSPAETNRVPTVYPCTTVETVTSGNTETIPDACPECGLLEGHQYDCLANEF